ncbi:MAG: ATP-binding cassette domain-containing protein [Alphaproteobacteria bacterium]|nr:ATP-binding cassette domain-containing protein [Alphaproteobacteria bacterium]
MVRLDDIGLRYGRGPEVLHGISFSLPEGSFHWLTGPSGAGKTSLIRLLSLTERPSRGTISLFGRNPDGVGRNARQALRRQIGVVYQDFRLLGHLTAFDNVALPLRLAGEREAAIAANTAELLAWVGLAERMAARPVTLSGGEQQRLAIARAVVAGPRLIVADEPTGDLDERQAERLLGLLVSLHRNGTTLLVATHNERLIERFPAPRLALSHGRLVAQDG